MNLLGRDYGLSNDYSNKKFYLLNSLGSKSIAKDFCDKYEETLESISVDDNIAGDKDRNACIEDVAKTISNRLLVDDELKLTYDDFKTIEDGQYIHRRHLDPSIDHHRPDRFKGNNHLLHHVIHSLNNAYMEKSNLTNDILRLPGMSGYKTRHFYNNLCSLQLEDNTRNSSLSTDSSLPRKAQYIEVGTWKGSSVISAMYNNQETIEGTVIDSWSQFNLNGNIKQIFRNHLNRFQIHNITIIETDFFTYDLSQLNQKYDIYLYDGAHEENDHYQAILRMWPYLRHQCIIVVDDWNFKKVQRGTYKAFLELNVQISGKFEILDSYDGTSTGTAKGTIDVWNGIGIFVIQK
jgi:predicted O-methyltransferase YrrM